MATGSSDQAEIEIENEKYSLVSVPKANCSLVREERKNLVGSLDLKEFANSMERVGEFIKLAYNGVNAAGPNFVDLKIEVQRLGFDITRLCNESSVTIDRFRSTAATVSSELVSVYHFLLDGFEDVAIQSLASLGELAKEMAKIAHDLKEKFIRQKEEVKTTMETTQKEESKQAKRNEELKKKHEEVELEKQEQEKIVKRYFDLAQEAKEERMKYELKEEKELAQSDGGNGFLEFVSLAISILPWVSGNRDKEYSLERAKRYGEMAKEKLEYELKMEQYHLEGLQKMTEFAAKLQNLKTETELARAAKDALHEAVGALSTLAVIMEKAATFWTYIEIHCQKMVTTEIMDKITMCAKMDEERKKKFWNNPGFIKTGVSYHAHWVALQGVCEEYGKSIEATRSSLYRYIQENPTCEQSIKHLPELTKKFTDGVNKGKKSIEENANEKKKQIKALTEYENN